MRRSKPVVALGTPASDLGPSGYPNSASVIAFGSSSVSGSGCSGTKLTLTSVSLFAGAVTASSVEATDGKGTVSGLEIDGRAVSVTAGQTVPVESWGQLTLGETLGRLTAPLVLRLVQAHDGLRAGIRIAIAFAAAPQPFKPRETEHSSPGTHLNQRTNAKSQRHANGANSKKKHQRRQPRKPPPDFPASTSPFAKSGGFTAAAQKNPVVSIAMRYLGVPYQWGGALPRTGFDCSGLVTYVFGQLGVPLVHYAAAQWHSSGGVWIPPDRLQAGDLVFFTGSDGTRKAPGHVGIYVDDGYFIDAPHTGSFVRVDSLKEPRFANEYVGARQVVSQRLLARRLSHVTKPDTPATAFHLGLPSPLTIRPLGESVGVAAAGTVTVRTASRGDWTWAGVALGSILLLLFAGALVVRRRGRPHDAIPSSEVSN